MRIQPYIPYPISIENETLGTLVPETTTTRKPLRPGQTHAHFAYPTYAPLVEERAGVLNLLEERPEMWNLLPRLD